MTHERDLERLLDSWFVDGPLVVADRVIDDTAARIARQPQRPAWRLRSWRFPTMSTPIRAVVLVGALLAAIAAGAILSGGGKAPPTLPPSPAATASAAASASPSSPPSTSAIACEDQIPGCAGLLSAGGHASSQLSPRLTFSVTAGWTNSIDSPSIFKLDPADSSRPYIIVWTNPTIVDQAKDCTIRARPDLGDAVDDWVQFLTHHAALEATAPVDVALPTSPSIQKATGKQIDLRMKDSWPSCPAGRGFAFIRNIDPLAGQQDYGVGDQRMRVILLANAGRTIIIQVYGPTDEPSFQRAMADVMPTIDTFGISPAEETPSASAPATACQGNTTGCAGPLTAGIHASAQFKIPLTLTVPAGWTNDRDITRTYGVSSTSTTDVVPHIQVMANIAVAEQTARCDPVVKPGADTSVAGLIQLVRAHPGLVSTAPVPITIDGHRGQRIDFHLSNTWGTACEGFNTGESTVMMLTDTGTPPGRVVSYTSDVRARWDVIEVGGESVVIECFAKDADFDAVIGPEQQIVDSIRFTP